MDKLLACLLALLLLITPAHAARLFDGSSQSLQSASAIDLTAFDKITVAWWGWEDNHSAVHVFLETSSDSAANPGSFVFASNSTPIIALDLQGTGGTNERTFTPPSTGAWHHYIATLQITAPGDIIKFFIDGVDTTPTGGSGGNTRASFDSLVLNVMARNNTTFWTPGRMAELGIWGGINFSQTDADALYNSGAGADATTVQGASLHNYWHLCGTSGSSTEPATTGGVDMTVHGATFTAHPISGMCGAGGYILTEVSDCINAENADRLITEDATAGVGPCVTAGVAAPPMRTLMGVGQ